MDIIKHDISKNLYYKKTKPMSSIQGIMIGIAGDYYPSASDYIDTKVNRFCIKPVSVHAVIDSYTSNVHQCMDWTHNIRFCKNNYIQILICYPEYNSKTFKSPEQSDEFVLHNATTYITLVDLVAKLCMDYNLDPLGDVISNKEYGINDTPAIGNDPEHIWACLGTTYTMSNFRYDVNDKINEVLEIDDEQETMELDNDTNDNNALSEDMSTVATISVSTSHTTYEDKPIVEVLKDEVDKLNLKSESIELSDNTTACSDDSSEDTKLDSVRFTVQVYAFFKKSDAHDLYMKLKNSIHHSVHLRKIDNLWVVHVGDCKVEESAKKILNKLNDMGYTNAFVATRIKANK